MNIRRAALAAALSVVFAAGLAACGNSANEQDGEPVVASMTQDTKMENSMSGDGMKGG